jgi:hypothetical protein
MIVNFVFFAKFLVQSSVFIFSLKIKQTNETMEKIVYETDHYY